MSMASIMLKTIEYGQWIVKRLIKKGGIWQKRKFPQKVMVWLGACSEWTFQQDGAKPHIHVATQEWCWKNLVNKSTGPKSNKKRL